MSATNITVGATNVSLWTTYILRKFVDGLKANLFFTDYCKPAQIPKGAGGYVARWNIPTMRIGSVTALTDGSLPAASGGVTITGVEATIADYGEWINVTDLAKETQITGAADVYSDIMSYAGAGSINTLIYNQAVAATNFLHAGDTTTAGVTLASGDVLKAKDIPAIANFFRGKNAKGFQSLGGDYMLAIHPDDEYDLITNVTTDELSWSDVNKHTPKGYEQLINNHQYVGRLAGVTVLRTTLIGTVTEDIAARRCVALADYGIGWLGLGGTPSKMPQIKYKTPGEQSTNDPLDMNCTLGWKVRMATKILDAGNRALVVYTDAA